MVNRAPPVGKQWVPGGSLWDFRDLVHGFPWVPAGSREDSLFNRGFVHGLPWIPTGSLGKILSLTAGSHGKSTVIVRPRGLPWEFPLQPRVLLGSPL